MNEPNVLIIEDDSTLLRGLTDNFRSHGFRVRTAQHGREGLAAALTKSPDLIILDIMLPDLNGYEICRELRRHNHDTTIIMLTAKGQEADIVRGLELGADDYVTKPFSIRELLARAKAFLRRKSAPVSEVVRFGEFTLDRKAHTLHRNHQEIELTSKEYRLLEYLVTNPGRALTRGDILDAVWGQTMIVTDRSVDRCITTLRAKIETDSRHPAWIRTIRDVGYRFEADWSIE
jgi:DNA-binding response OmpR family regulator